MENFEANTDLNLGNPQVDLTSNLTQDASIQPQQTAINLPQVAPLEQQVTFTNSSQADSSNFVPAIVSQAAFQTNNGFNGQNPYQVGAIETIEHQSIFEPLTQKPLASSFVSQDAMTASTVTLTNKDEHDSSVMVDHNTSIDVFAPLMSEPIIRNEVASIENNVGPHNQAGSVKVQDTEESLTFISEPKLIGPEQDPGRPKKVRPRRIYPVTIKNPKRPFRELSTSQQRRLVYQIIDGIDLVAKEDIDIFMDVLRRKTEFGLEHFPPKEADQNLKSIVRKVGALYNSCPSEHKPDVLSLVAKEFSTAQLTNLGFKDISKAKHNYSAYKKGLENISLNKYKRHVPPSRAKFNHEKQANILNSLMKFSTLTAQNVTKPVVLEFDAPGYKPDKFYHLNTSIRNIHRDHEATYNLKVSLAAFSTYIPKNFIKVNKGKNVKYAPKRDGPPIEQLMM